MSKLIIQDVSLRDGLQSEAVILSTAQKMNLFRGLVKSGIRNIELGSFVRSDRVPQMADTPLLFKKAKSWLKKENIKKCNLAAFVPNVRGLELALEADVDQVGAFYAVSNEFCKANVNSSKKILLKKLTNLVNVAQQNKLNFRVYLSTSFHCPYTGKVKLQSTLKSIKQLMDLGVQDIVLSDTTGFASPLDIRNLLCLCLEENMNLNLFSLHLHDTRAMALANISEAFDFGIRRFDASLSGLGGCPYAPGASGNVCLEDMLLLLRRLGGRHNVDLLALKKLSLKIQKLFPHNKGSHISSLPDKLIL